MPLRFPVLPTCVGVFGTAYPEVHRRARSECSPLRPLHTPRATLSSVQRIWFRPDDRHPGIRRSSNARPMFDDATCSLITARYKGKLTQAGDSSLKTRMGECARITCHEPVNSARSARSVVRNSRQGKGGPCARRLNSPEAYIPPARSIPRRTGTSPSRLPGTSAPSARSA